MEEMACLISIIVPVFNVEKRLRVCLDSILRQSLKNIEIILVDDGSTDESGWICNQYAEKDNRIKVFHLNNGGPARARNYGIQKAMGKYVGFVDSDDYISPIMYEKLYSDIEENQSDIAMCSYFIEGEDFAESVDLQYCELYEDQEIVRSQLLYCYYTKKHKGLYSLCNKLFRRKMIVQNDIKLDEHLMRGEDAWFVFKCLKVAKRVSFQNIPLYYYYQNNLSIMHSVRMDQFERWVETRKRLLKENEQLNFRIDYNDFYSEFMYNVAVYCKQLITIGEKDKVIEILNDDFLENAFSYCSKLPIHIKFLHKLAELNLINVAIIFYKLWSMKDAK